MDLSMHKLAFLLNPYRVRAARTMPGRPAATTRPTSPTRSRATGLSRVSNRPRKPLTTTKARTVPRTRPHDPA